MPPASNPEVEVRSLPLERIEIRDREDGAGSTITGYAAVFDSESEDMFGFREIIRPGAFSRTLRENPDVFAFWQHDPSRVLGRTKSKTLSVREDEKGLQFDLEPPDSPTGHDALESIRRGDVSKVSFGFIVRDDRLIKRSDGTYTRELLDVDLIEVSPVTFPAYSATHAEVRSRIEALDAQAAETAAPATEAKPLRLDLLKRQVEIAEKECL